MNISPIAAALNGFSGSGQLARAGHRQPEFLRGARALHGDHGEIAAGLDPHLGCQAVALDLDPGQVLVGATGVDHHPEPGLVEEVDDEVVDDAAALVQHAGIQRAAAGLQLVDVVGEEFSQEIARARAADVDRQHVRDVEHAGIVAHDVVLVELRTIMQRHFPAGEIDQLGVGLAVPGVEGGLS
jgi:hypothetical protein